MDLDDDDYGTPFAIPDLWKPSSLSQEDTQTSTVLLSRLDLDGDSVLLEEHSWRKLPDFGAYQLDHFQWGPLQDLGRLSDVSTTSDANSVHVVEPRRETSEDPWIIAGRPLDDEAPAAPPSWDTFLDPTSTDPPTPYLSEAGPKAYDAILQAQLVAHVDASHAPKLVRTDALLSALFELGLGRSSVLFWWNEDQQQFLSRLGPVRLSGVSKQTTQSICDELLKCGADMRYLDMMTEQRYMSGRSATHMAVVDAITTVASTLQACLSAAKSSTHSLLQLRAIFERPRLVVSYFRDILVATSAARDDEHLLSTLYDMVQGAEHRLPWLREALLEILSRVSKPWLESVACWIGLRDRMDEVLEGGSKTVGLVHTEQRSWVDDRGSEVSTVSHELDPRMVPTFMTDDDARVIFETGKGLRLLQALHPEHPLATSRVEQPRMEWKFSWDHLDRIQAQCEAYEHSIIGAIQKYSSRNERPDRAYAASKRHLSRSDRIAASSGAPDGLALDLKASAAVMDAPLPDHCAHPTDRLGQLILATCSPTDANASQALSTFAPPIPLTPLLSFCPLVTTQARLVNSSSMRLLFREHHLRSHFSVQRRFHLFGDGAFAARISHALFDPELATAERRHGRVRTGGNMGLQLGSREHWPPASSELRLALMGVLTESYHDGAAVDSPSLSARELPGKLSFAVRDMSAAEAERCRDPHAIEALDFLRLHYQAPPALEPIITTTSLSQYDIVFKFLLRVVRMNFVVNQLFRDVARRGSHGKPVDMTALRFRIEAHHFVASMCSYCFDVGIGPAWRRLEGKLDEIESRMRTEDRRGTMGLTPSLDSLRLFHERILDQMMFALLLRKRQAPVMKLLEEIFTVILTFARHSHQRAAGVQEDEAHDVRRMYSRFRKRVGVFVGICRGLSERRSPRSRGEGPGPEGGDAIGQLLLKLEMNAFYSASSR